MRFYTAFILATCTTVPWLALGTWSIGSEPNNLTDQARLAEAAALLNRVDDLIARERLAEAVMSVEKAVAIRREVLGEKHRDTAAALVTLGDVLDRKVEREAARRCFEQALAINREVLGEKHLDTAAVLVRLGRSVQLGDPRTARNNYLAALKIQQELLGQEHEETANTLVLLGHVVHRLGDDRAARTYFESALAIRRKVLGEKHPLTAESFNKVGDIVDVLGDKATARKHHEQALAIQRQALGPKHETTLETLTELGGLLGLMKEVQEARKCFEEAYTIQLELHGDRHVKTARSLDLLTLSLEQAGEFDKATELAKQAMQRIEASGDEDSPFVLAVLGILERISLQRGDYDALVAHTEHILAIQAKLHGESSDDAIDAKVDLGRALAAQGDLAKALRECERAMDLAGSSATPEVMARVLDCLGGLQVASGDLEKARDNLETALGIRKSSLGEKHLDTAESFNNVGCVLQKMKLYSAARRHYERALLIRKQALGDANPNTALSYTNLGSVLVDMGDLAAARTNLEKSLRLRRSLLQRTIPWLPWRLITLGICGCSWASTTKGANCSRKHSRRTAPASATIILEPLSS